MVIMRGKTASVLEIALQGLSPVQVSTQTNCGCAKMLTQEPPRSTASYSVACSVVLHHPSRLTSSPNSACLDSTDLKCMRFFFRARHGGSKYLV